MKSIWMARFNETLYVDKRSELKKVSNAKQLELKRYTMPLTKVDTDRRICLSGKTNG